MSFGIAWLTMTAKSARAARWFWRSLASQLSLQCLVRFDSQRIVPHTAPEEFSTRCSTSPPNSPFGTGVIVSCGNREAEDLIAGRLRSHERLFPKHSVRLLKSSGPTS